MRGTGVKYPQEAVDNYNQALTVLTKDKLPGDWKKTQNNLFNRARRTTAGERRLTDGRSPGG